VGVVSFFVSTRCTIQKRIEAELAQLLIDIRRIGPTFPDGEPHVLFGELFDDDNVQQYYEALVGILKSAKKRGVITFKAQMLLKGIHDNVQISIVQEGQDHKTQSTTAVTQTKQESTAVTQTTYISPFKQETPARQAKESPTRSAKKLPEKFTFSPSHVTPTATSPSASKRKSHESVDSSKDFASSSWRTFSKRKSEQSKSSPYLPSPHTFSPILTKQSQDVACTFSDGEAEVEVATRKYEAPPAPASCSDSEADGSSPRARRARRGRVTLPAAFLKQQSTIDLSGRPPAPRRMRKTQSTWTVTQSSAVSDTWTRRASTSTMEAKPLARKKEPLVAEAAKDKDVDVVMNDVAEKSETAVNASPSHKIMKSSEGEAPANYGNTKENDGDPSGNIASTKTSFSPSPARKSSDASPPRTHCPTTSFSASSAGKSSSLALSKEASFRVDSEVHRLVKDICRVGSNPGEPSVTFGELFDDEAVQQTYEALVGTLRSAKRQGFIKFQGQMLFKGMHDHVTIYVVEEKPAIAQAAA
jgi:hypothetical protein